NQHVALAAPVGERERARDLVRGAVALDARRVDQHRDRRKAALQRRQHVANRRAGRRRDDADALRHARQRALALRIEQPLGLELALQRLEAASQQPFAGFLDLVDDELELAAGFVKADPRADDDLLAVLEREAEVARGLTEHRAAYLRVRVLQRPVEMPRRRPGQVRNLALDPDRAEAALDKEPRFAIQRGD